METLAPKHRNSGLPPVIQPSSNVVANILDTEMLRIDENIDTLKQMLIEPCLGVIPRLTDISPQQVAAHLTIPD